MGLLAEIRLAVDSLRACGATSGSIFMDVAGEDLSQLAEGRWVATCHEDADGAYTLSTYVLELGDGAIKIYSRMERRPATEQERDELAIHGRQGMRSVLIRGVQ